MGHEVFDQTRIYDDDDSELDLIAPKAKRARWRHERIGPAFLKFGRRVKYHGADLNAWVQTRRVDTQGVSAN